MPCIIQKEQQRSYEDRTGQHSAMTQLEDRRAVSGRQHTDKHMGFGCTDTECYVHEVWHRGAERIFPRQVGVTSHSFIHLLNMCQAHTLFLKLCQALGAQKRMRQRFTVARRTGQKPDY